MNYISPKIILAYQSSKWKRDGVPLRSRFTVNRAKPASSSPITAVTPDNASDQVRLTRDISFQLAVIMARSGWF